MTGFFSSIGGYISHIGNVLSTITNDSLLGKLLIGTGAVALAYITPIVGLLITCFALTAVDMLYGIAVAKKQKQKITSDKNWQGTICKLWHELVLLLSARLVEFTVLGTSGVFVLTGGITVIISLTELWSIIENLNTINPNGPWKILGKFLKKKGEEYVGMHLDLDKKHESDTHVVKRPPKRRR